jgi:photoactive yellow protein
MHSFTQTDGIPSSVDPLALDRMSDAELDTLGFGVIGLDPSGVIRRYNQYESRLARLDRAQVLGRNFFEQVAKCTRVPEFEGRWRTMMETRAPRADRFPFVFDFVFGAQEVEVQMVLPPGSALSYVLIARKRATGVREDFPAELRAVQQRALAPRERAHGVLRDDVEVRVLEVPWSFLASLRATCERLAPETWTIFCHEWGVQWGRRLAVDLETTAIERYGRGLRELSMRSAGELLSERLREQGWGHLVLDFRHAPEGVLALEVGRSAIAESTRLGAPHAAQADGGRACHLLAGCLGAVLTHLGERRLSVLEVECAAMPPKPGETSSDRRCTFAAVSNRRRKAAADALEGGVRSVGALVEALRGAREER